MSLHFNALNDGVGDVLLGQLDRLRQIAPERQVTGYGGRVSASGPVRRNCCEERGGQEQLGLAVKKNVYRLLQGLEVTALDQGCATITTLDFASSGPEVFHGAQL